MRTLGIDLAAQPRNTAICAIDWDSGEVAVSMPEAGLDDAGLPARIGDADAVGIDAPFGWPEAFASNLARYADDGRWAPEASERLMYRETDRAVRSLAARRGSRAPFLAALIARAAFLGLTEPPTPAQERAASLEGWIHVPEADSLGRLA